MRKVFGQMAVVVLCASYRIMRQIKRGAGRHPFSRHQSSSLDSFSLKPIFALFASTVELTLEMPTESSSMISIERVSFAEVLSHTSLSVLVIPCLASSRRTFSASAPTMNLILSAFTNALLPILINIPNSGTMVTEPF